MANSKATIIQGKKIGILIQDARITAKKSIEECAAAIGVSTDTFQAYEFGSKSPSLPELEILAFYLNIPVDHFWGRTTLTESKPDFADLSLERLVPLRHKMIGALIRKARQEAGIDASDLAKQVGIKADELDAYEMGQKAVPTPILENLGKFLEIPVESFIDRSGPVGAWMAQQRGIQGFLDLDENLQDFVAKPINRPYLELAQRLSNMPAEKLRNIAEGLLEITL